MGLRIYIDLNPSEGDVAEVREQARGYELLFGGDHTNEARSLVKDLPANQQRFERGDILLDRVMYPDEGSAARLGARC